jgi:hypothetical protein
MISRRGSGGGVPRGLDTARGSSPDSQANLVVGRLFCICWRQWYIAFVDVEHRGKLQENWRKAESRRWSRECPIVAL